MDNNRAGTPSNSQEVDFPQSPCMVSNTRNISVTSPSVKLQKSMEKIKANQTGIPRRKAKEISPLRITPRPTWKWLFLFKLKTNTCYNIISLNSGGLKTTERFDTALKFCQDSGADFYILQEMHLGPNKYNEILNQWNREVYLSPDTTFRDEILPEK